jgi:hypothetical protein
MTGIISVDRADYASYGFQAEFAGTWVSLYGPRFEIPCAKTNDVWLHPRKRVRPKRHYPSPGMLQLEGKPAWVSHYLQLGVGRFGSNGV